MLKEKIYPYLLVFLQLSSLVFIISSAPVLASGYGGILIESAGFFLGILAIFQMGIGNFNISPLEKKDGIMVSSGIYRIIRHPMYLAQLVMLLPLVVDYFTYLRLVSWVLLLAVLLLKIQFEESRLVKQFEGYSVYQERTKKLIPFIY